jgi:hypothetical protein
VPLEAEALPPADPEIKLGCYRSVVLREAVDPPPVAFGLGRGERGEYPRRDREVASLDRECVVDD